MTYKDVLDKMVDSRSPYCPECKEHCRGCMSFYGCRPHIHDRTTEVWIVTNEKIALSGEYR